MRYILKSQIGCDILTISAKNMKDLCDGTTEFRIPLSLEALEVLKQAHLLS
ncbi:hypothetical protein [Bartonella harrusi]|uniref:hypothetical protein n=1 Tax=Bartonella harrusi TaxID=2961895 RepID=UPI0028680D69|nr:hypothetical protein [Bartonella harrusi]